jgi:hypothetical protein
MKKCRLISPIVIFLILTCQSANADEKNLKLNAGFEAGGGYNQLFWKTAADDKFYSETNSRTTVYLAPNLRLFARLGKIENFFVHTFAGFTELGGKSSRFKINPDDPYDYEDVMTYNTVELALLVGYSVNSFNIMLGYKHNIYTSVVFDPPEHFDEEEVYMTVDLPASSGNIGIRAEFEFSETMLSAELWFGLEKSIDIDTYRYSRGDSYRENHFRLIFSMPIFGSFQF